MFNNPNFGEPVSIVVSKKFKTLDIPWGYILTSRGNILEYDVRENRYGVVHSPYDIYDTRLQTLSSYNETSSWKKIINSKSDDNILYIANDKEIYKFYKTNFNLPVSVLNLRKANISMNNDSSGQRILSFDNTLYESPDGKWEVVPPFNREYEAEVKGDKLFRFEFGEVDQFYFNDGKGNFNLIDITKENFYSVDGGPIDNHLRDWGLVAQFRDMNNDGHPDIYICNDFESPDRIWINNGDGSFNEIEKTAVRHTSNSSMSVDFSDLNKDGYVDFFVSDMLSQSHIMKKTQMGTMLPTVLLIGEIENRPQYMRNTLFLNRKDHTFSEIGQYSKTYASEWSWASAFMDVDLDGNEDMLITTGHVYDVQDSDSIEKQKKVASSVRSFDEYKRMLLSFPTLELKNVAFKNKGNLKFETVKDAWGIGKEEDISHGMAFGDLDNDGDLDVVINRLNQNVGLFRNNTKSPRVSIRLEGKAPNTNAIGAKIKVPHIINDIGRVLAQPVSINRLPIMPLNKTVTTGANDAIVELKNMIIKFLLNIYRLLYGVFYI